MVNQSVCFADFCFRYKQDIRFSLLKSLHESHQACSCAQQFSTVNLFRIICRADHVAAVHSHLDHNEVTFRTPWSWLSRHVNTLVTNKCLPQEVFSTGCSLWCMSWFTAVVLLFIASLRPLLPVFLSSAVERVKENKLCHRNDNVEQLKKGKKYKTNWK